jgi:hypothetical protein
MSNTKVWATAEEFLKETEGRVISESGNHQLIHSKAEPISN